MDIPALHAFLAVADSGSFSQAAVHLGLTQPAVSKRIRQLEQNLGATLFDRIGRRIRLTEAGRILAPRARQIVSAAEDSRRLVANLSREVTGPLVFGTSHHVGLHRLPETLRDYRRRYPDVQLDIRFLDSEAACAAVAKGELELAVVTLPRAPEPELVVVPVWDDPMALVTPVDHPLAQKGTVEPAELAAVPAVLPAPGTYTREIIEERFAAMGLRPEVTMATNYLETIKMLVSVGLGWSVLPRSMVDEEVAVCHCTGIELGRTLGIVRHRARTLSNAGEALLRLLPVSGGS